MKAIEYLKQYERAEKRADRYETGSRSWKMAKLDSIEKRQEIFEMIVQIGGIESDILYNRYILFMTWEKVAEVCGKSDKWCRTKLHDRALKIVQNQLDTMHK